MQVTLADIASPDYLSALRERHATSQWGRNGHVNAEGIIRFARRIGAENALDYGCGKGTLKPVLEILGLPCDEYDPAVPGKDSLPSRVRDLVVCAAVLEHVEPRRLDAVLSHIRRLATLGVFFTIGKRHKSNFPEDDDSGMLVVRTDEWWSARLEQAGWANPAIIASSDRLVTITCGRSC